MQTPCRNCENKGCGAYHDICEPYQEFVEANNKLKDIKKKDLISHKTEYIRDDTFRSRGSKIMVFKKEKPNYGK